VISSAQVLLSSMNPEGIGWISPSGGRIIGWNPPLYNSELVKDPAL